MPFQVNLLVVIVVSEEIGDGCAAESGRLRDEYFHCYEISGHGADYERRKCQNNASCDRIRDIYIRRDIDI